MITIITGVPGSGKTLYAITKLLQSLVGTTIKYEDESGNEVEAPRTIYTNIRGLLLDHELIGPGGEWVSSTKGGVPGSIAPPTHVDGDAIFVGSGQGLRDWHKWAKPGSVIVFDEVQEVWKPRPNGAAVPPDIGKLETHRHMGVDFVLLTQNVMLVDRNIHALAGRHLHVRRVANLNAAIVYEWDAVSRGLLYAKAINRTPWRYDKKVFKLYRSAVAHTKQKRSLPAVLWAIPIAAAILVWKAPVVYSGLTGKELFPSATAKPAQTPAQPKIEPSPQASKPAAKQPGQLPAAADINFPGNWFPRMVDRPDTAPVYDHLRQVVAVPKITGAMCVDGRCRCFTQQRTEAEISPEACEAWAYKRPFDPYKPDQPLPAAVMATSAPQQRPQEQM